MNIINSRLVTVVVRPQPGVKPGCPVPENRSHEYGSCQERNRPAYGTDLYPLSSYRTTCRNGMSFGMSLGTCSLLSNVLRAARSYKAPAVRFEPHDLLAPAGAAS